MAEQITFPADNSTFTIGNTTYVWDDPPGIWRAYTVGDFSGGGGGGSRLTSGFPISPPDSTGSFTFPGGGLTGTGMGQVLYGHIVPGSNIGSVYIATNTTGTAWVQSGTTRDQSVASSASFMAFIGLDDVISCGNNGFEANYAAWDVVEDTSGSSTTVNIGGGGAGLQLGVTAKDTITTSTTITADDLSGTGPAWVLLGGGGGSGAVAQYNRVNNPSGSAGAGGAGGNYGFFLNDSASLVGASFTAGASGTAQSNVGVNVGDGTTVIFGSNGTAGTTSTLVLDGTTYTCTGGGGGTRGTPGTAGAAGTASATGGTPLDLIDVQTINTDIDTYWDGFIVVETGGNLRLGGNTADAAITGSGGGAGDAAFASPQGPDGEGPVREVTSGSGSAGSLQIVYQNQA